MLMNASHRTACTTHWANIPRTLISSQFRSTLKPRLRLKRWQLWSQRLKKLRKTWFVWGRFLRFWLNSRHRLRRVIKAQAKAKSTFSTKFCNSSRAKKTSSHSCPYSNSISVAFSNLIKLSSIRSPRQAIKRIKSLLSKCNLYVLSPSQVSKKSALPFSKM